MELPSAERSALSHIFHLPPGLLRFSYQEKAWATYEFGHFGPQGPSAFFDTHGNVLLISPADRFLISRMDELPDGGTDSRVLATIQTLPAGFTHTTLIVAGHGVNRTFAAWGRTLLALSGKQPVSDDHGVVLSKLGYWTDNGAHYYYQFEPRLGYAGTLLAVRDEFTKLGVPLGYMQLDSWWYPKGPDARWDAKRYTIPFGEYFYRADKALFPDGLAAFQKSLGLPIVTHARWVSSASPYRQKFKVSSNVIVDPSFWSETAAYLRGAGVATYEQDWLDHNALPDLNLTDPQAFLGEMSAAMQSAGIDIQYCMPLPAHYVASTLYPNVETIRTSSDRLSPQNWDAFLYSSRLAAAVGLWPWTDVFYSSELGNLILSTLSGGPVGVGDALGDLNAQNLLAVMRKDGVLIKPDSPLLPIDAMYVSDAANRLEPMVAVAETRFTDSSIRYVFSYPRKTVETTSSVSLSDLGISGPAYAYDWVARKGRLIRAEGTLDLHFKDGFAYNILVPVTRDGIALLGDLEKIVPLGKQRVAAVEDRNTLRATIKFAPGERIVTISGYASSEPQIMVSEGKLIKMQYNRETNIFQVLLGPSISDDAVLRISAHSAPCSSGHRSPSDCSISEGRVPLRLRRHTLRLRFAERRNKKCDLLCCPHFGPASVQFKGGVKGRKVPQATPEAALRFLKPRSSGPGGRCAFFE